MTSSSLFQYIYILRSPSVANVIEFIKIAAMFIKQHLPELEIMY